jgi:hypothetical protein
MSMWRARHMIAGALITLSPGGALAQVSTSQPGCVEIVALRSDAHPAGAILLNRCSGQTWMLVRYQSTVRGSPVYRWSAIASDSNEPRPPLPAAPAASADKCFTFQGRRFCE